MRNALAAALFLCAAAAFAGTSATPPSTTNNDDSCDIALQPAATLLLPYFEVDIQTRHTTTLFTIQNLSPVPVVANVTLWTDWGYPALDFPLLLTGYDVEGIDLYDVFVNGTMPPSECGRTNLSPLLPDLQSMFRLGKGTAGALGCTSQVGGVHYDAIGYATIDLVASCAAKNAASSDYFETLLFDNILTGDYQQLWSGGQAYASSSPLVHIRAIPEGGAAGAVVVSSLPSTFYDRYAPVRKSDRRQPLPSAFAARYINGLTGGFATTVKIWRETRTAGACNGAQAAASNSNMPLTEVVRFDERENATIIVPGNCFFCGPGPIGIPVTGSYAAFNTTLFPPFSTSGDAGGWLYLNVGNQSWMSVSMYAAPTYSAEAVATALGNGCSPTMAKGAQIGPTP
jgi:hypothetical protein